jgi:hypothetical protein
MALRGNFMSNHLIRLLVIATLGCALISCAGPPDWVEEGSGDLNQDDPQSIYGVGSIVGVKNEPLAW